MQVKPMDELRRIAAALEQRQAELAATGIGFSVRTSRRLTIHGISHRLLLDVLPETGFDNFAWDAFLRDPVRGRLGRPRTECR